MTENPFSTQGWNRDSYVGNSPVNFTDPSGYCFMGCFWQPVFRAIGNLFRRVPILGTILQIGAAVACAPAGLSSVCAAAASAFVTGVTSGNLGMALRAVITAYITAEAFTLVGKMTAGNFGAKILGHAAIGCVSAVASGGRCGNGAVSAAAGALGTQFGLVGASFLGGLASVATGGNFANGATAAAFGYLFNALQGRNGIYATWQEVGDEAHVLFGTNRATRFYPAVMTEVTSEGRAIFGGSVDLLNWASHELWEIKSINDVNRGVKDVNYYAANSGGRYFPGGPSILPEGKLTLTGILGSYTFTAAPGVVGYSFVPNPGVHVVTLQQMWFYNNVLIPWSGVCGCPAPKPLNIPRPKALP